MLRLNSARRFGARPPLPLWATLAYLGAVVALVTTLVALSVFHSEPPDRIAASVEVDEAPIAASRDPANEAPNGVPSESDADWVEEPHVPTF